MPEVVTFGECMLRFTPESTTRLQDAQVLQVSPGGAELNVAVALCNLGTAAGWISRLADNGLGRRIHRDATAQAVDLSQIQWDTDSRQAIYFLERPAKPRPPTVLYDRNDSAARRFDRGAIDWPTALHGARMFVSSGITAALGGNLQRAMGDGMMAANRAGVEVVFDTNYRSLLWSASEFRACLESILGDVDHLFSNESDLEHLGASPAELRDRFELQTVNISMRSSEGGIQRRASRGIDGGGNEWSSPWVEFEQVDPLGGGDAFVAGMLHTMLAGKADPAFADTLAALCQTTPGDFSTFSADDVRAYMHEQRKISR